MRDADRIVASKAHDLTRGRVHVTLSGPNQIDVAFGNGNRCVGGNTFRLSTLTVGAGGTAYFAVDLTSPSQPSGAITSGSTWNFQFWYRDPGGPCGTTYNVTNAVAVTFD